MARVLESKQHPEQGFRSCLGIIRLGETYGGERVEAAARRTLNYRKYSSMSLASILETGLDSLPDTLAEPPKPPLGWRARLGRRLAATVTRRYF